MYGQGNTSGMFALLLPLIFQFINAQSCSVTKIGRLLWAGHAQHMGEEQK
jgi:hypothetical protein